MPSGFVVVVPGPCYRSKLWGVIHAVCVSAAAYDVFGSRLRNDAVLNLRLCQVHSGTIETHSILSYALYVQFISVTMCIKRPVSLRVPSAHSGPSTRSTVVLLLEEEAKFPPDRAKEHAHRTKSTSLPHDASISYRVWEHSRYIHHVRIFNGLIYATTGDVTSGLLGVSSLRKMSTPHYTNMADCTHQVCGMTSVATNLRVGLAKISTLCFSYEEVIQEARRAA